jgi:hypothetical protein
MTPSTLASGMILFTVPMRKEQMQRVSISEGQTNMVRTDVCVFALLFSPFFSSVDWRYFFKVFIF